jgi:hypothetical protein
MKSTTMNIDFTPIAHVLSTQQRIVLFAVLERLRYDFDNEVVHFPETHANFFGIRDLVEHVLSEQVPSGNRVELPVEYIRGLWELIPIFSDSKNDSIRLAKSLESEFKAWS